jgi:hypothetical protein
VARAARRRDDRASRSASSCPTGAGTLA